MNHSCALHGHRTLRSVRLSSSSAPACAAPVLRDVGTAALAVVATFSAGGLAARSGYRELNQLGLTLLHQPPALGAVRALLVGKGTRCGTTAATPLAESILAGTAHCIEGPNVGAREAHTIWAFCYDFYHHLPRAALFVQDDPHAAHLRRELLQLQSWYATLEASFSARRQLRQQIERDPAAYTPWVPAGCACTVVREPFSSTSYGGYRPMHWWMRSFLSPFTNETYPLPSHIAWPATAQFALPRSALQARSRAFFELNVRLSEVAAPLKQNVPRAAAHSDQLHARTAKWANFGPLVVDLGAAPPRGAGYADVRPGINGMDFAQVCPPLASSSLSHPPPASPRLASPRLASPRCCKQHALRARAREPPASAPPQLAMPTRPAIESLTRAQLYERSWFQAFDPALAEARPEHPQCFRSAAIRLAPIRCAHAACPHREPRLRTMRTSSGGDGGGCASTDALGLTTPPRDWPFAPERGESAQLRRCLGAGCLTDGKAGSLAWVQSTAAAVDGKHMQRGR